MSSLLIVASTVISLALVAYTIGTTIMTIMAQGSGGAISPLHGITGLLAIVLMLFHAGWATYVTVRGNAKARHSFHLLSICVWLVWLVPYFVGLLIGIPVFHVSDAFAVAFAAGMVVVLAFFLLAPRGHGHRA